MTEPAQIVDLDAAEARLKQQQLRHSATLLKGAQEVVPGARRYMENLQYHEAALDLLQKPKAVEPGADPLQEALDLARLTYDVAVDRLQELRKSKEALLAEQSRLQEVIRTQEDAIIVATADEKVAALNFASGGEVKLRAARARLERATAIRDEARREMEPLTTALENVDAALTSASAAKNTCSGKIWSAVAKLRFRDAQPGVKLLAEAWLCRCKSLEGTLRLEEFLMMSYRQHVPSPEAGAGIERRLHQEFFAE